MQTLATRLAPMQLIALAFDQLELDLRIWHTINRVEQSGIIHLVDSLALTKTIYDDIFTLDMTDLPIGGAGAYGGIIRRLLELDLAEDASHDEALKRPLARPCSSTTSTSTA